MNLHYQNLTVDELLKKLAEETQKLVQLMSSKNMGAEYQSTKQLIKELQEVIEEKKLALQNPIIIIQPIEKKEEPGKNNS
jgi:hypothetical protein